MTITKEEIRQVLGPVEDGFAAEIVATGASFQDLMEAWAWLNSDEALINEGHHLPSPRVAELVAMLEPEQDEDHG